MFTTSDRVQDELIEHIAESDAESNQRAQLIHQIITTSPTVSRAFLDQFSGAELSSYLAHLHAAAAPRNRHARWVREDTSPAAVGRASRW